MRGLCGRLVGRWLRRRPWTPAWVRVIAALALGTIFLISVASASFGAAGGPPTTLPNAPEKSPDPPGPGGRITRFPSSPQLVSQGRSLYETGCASCHGALLQGVSGNGPSLVGVGPGPVDFYLSSGRMPLDNPTQEPERGPPAYNRHQIDALIAFVTRVGGGPGAPAADPADGSLAVGFHVFTANCAGCHQSLARGGLVLGAFVPDLQHVTPQQVAEAVRMGPYLMPHFDARQINQYQLDSLAKYVRWTRHPSNYGGWGLGNIGPIPEGMVAWFIGAASLVLVARLIGERLTSE